MQFDKSSSGTKQRKTVAVCSSLHIDDKIELIRSGTQLRLEQINDVT